MFLYSLDVSVTADLQLSGNRFRSTLPTGLEYLTNLSKFKCSQGCVKQTEMLDLLLIHAFQFMLSIIRTAGHCLQWNDWDYSFRVEWNDKSGSTHDA